MAKAKAKAKAKIILDDKTLQNYRKFVEKKLTERFQYQGKIDGADFLAGAACFYIFLEILEKISPTWVLGTPKLIDELTNKKI